MIPHPDDLIVALSSAPGIAARAVIRISGRQARTIVDRLFRGDGPVYPRTMVNGFLHLDDWPAIPASLLWFTAPRSYTGQDLAEFHTIASAPIVEAILQAIGTLGARPAQPGEFTLRSFLAGKCDLPRAEAVLAVIESRTDAELRDALAQLAGGVTRPLDGLRDDLLNLLADVEAALDFVDEDIEFVERPELLNRLARGLAQLMTLNKQLGERSVSGRAYRVALVGEPNAGKSSLFNALTRESAAIVSPTPGTTRDYLVRALDVDDANIELIDTAGWEEAAETIEAQAQRLGRDQAAQADLLLWCQAADRPSIRTPEVSTPYLIVMTQCDRAEPPPGFLATSALTGRGLDALQRAIVEKAGQGLNPLALSGSRCRHHVEAALQHLQAAHHIVLFNDPPELLALELRLALDHLGELVGAVHTDDLLDRIFSRFCIGK